MSSSHYFALQIQELRRRENLYLIRVHWFTTIEEVKAILAKILHCSMSSLRMFRYTGFHSLPNHTTLRELGIETDGHTIHFSYERSNINSLIEPVKGVVIDEPCKEMLCQVASGLKSSKTSPAKTDILDGTGGVYFLRSVNGNNIAVFKPQDEEQGMPNNPKDRAGNGSHCMRPYFKPGDGYFREYAAYLLDHKGFFCVPATTLVYCEHSAFHYPINHSTGKSVMFPKLGSLQKYVRAYDTFENLSPSLISVFELQKIALLDMRILNCDRNSANILVVQKHTSGSLSSMSSERRTSRSSSVTSWGDENDSGEMDLRDFVNKRDQSTSQFELIPIDHGYCLPTKLLIDEFDWVWFNTPQISQPVHPDIVSIMNEIDIDDMIKQMTAQMLLPSDSIYLLRVVHCLLKKGINNGMTLQQLAELIVRTEENVPSALERICSDSIENAYRFIEIHDKAGSTKLKAHGESSDYFLEVNGTQDDESLPMGYSIKPESYSKPLADMKTCKEFQSEDSEQLKVAFSDSTEIFDIRISQPIIHFKSTHIGFESQQQLEVIVQSTECVPEEKSMSQSFLTRLESFDNSLLAYSRNEMFGANGIPDYYSDIDLRKISSFGDKEVDGGSCRFDSECLRIKSTENTNEKLFSDYKIESCSYDPPLPLSRVVSFGAFDSPPLYDSERLDGKRHMLRLKRERRKLAMNTPEFQLLRCQFAFVAVENVVMKYDRKKQK